VTGTITLTGVAGPGGTVVSLTSSDPTAIVGKSVTIAQGTNSASFDIQTIGVSSASSAVIQATNGNVAVRSTLTILPSSLMSVSMNPRRIAGGLSGIGVVTLTGFAPPGGTTVSLSSSSGIVQVPSTITIRSGQSTATFIFQTQSRSDSAVVTISASAGSTVSTALYVYPSWLLSVSVFPTKVIGGAMATGKVTLVGTAPYGGSVITLTSSDPSVTMPSSITIPAGQSSVTFQIHTNIGADNLSVLINAQSESGDTATTTLTIQV